MIAIAGMVVQEDITGAKLLGSLMGPVVTVGDSASSGCVVNYQS